MNHIVQSNVKKHWQEQVIMDNRVIGEEVLNFLHKNIATNNEDQIIQTIQTLCDDISLPNNGFICAIRNDGNLVAAPGLNQGDSRNLNIVGLTEHSVNQSSDIESLNPDKQFDGILKYEGGEKTNIIASIPIGELDLRLNVHQDNEAIMQRAKAFIKPMYPIGIISAFIIALLGFIISDRIIKRYENRIENHEISVYQGDIVYLSSDGFADQFGGPEGKKFMVNRFIDLLNRIHSMPMSKQKEEFDKTLSEWIGNNDQIDDILVMGVKIW